MSARILVVDDVPANVKLLEARLSAEYFDVMTASNGTSRPLSAGAFTQARACASLLSMSVPSMSKMTPRSNCYCSFF